MSVLDVCMYVCALFRIFKKKQKGKVEHLYSASGKSSNINLLPNEGCKRHLKAKLSEFSSENTSLQFKHRHNSQTNKCTKLEHKGANIIMCSHLNIRAGILRQKCFAIEYHLPQMAHCIK